MPLWFEEWFASEDYLTVYKHRDEKEAELFRDLLLQTISLGDADEILDLGCGAGRHVLLFAEKGYRVTGVDQSEKLLEVARREAQLSGLHATFLRGDIRTISFKRQFRLILNIFTSFGYFEDDAQNFLLFSNVEKLLADNGTFVFDFLNEKYVRKNLIPQSLEKIENIVVNQNRRIENNRVIKDIELQKNGTSSNYTESVALYSYETILTHLNRSGLYVSRMFGNYNGDAFDLVSSPRLILLCGRQKL